MPEPLAGETLTHRLILPRDANHYGTLFAGGLLSLALEAAYATAYRTIGASANLVLKRVLDVRCFEPVKVGRVIEIRGQGGPPGAGDGRHRPLRHAPARPVEDLDGRPDAVRPGRPRGPADPDRGRLARRPTRPARPLGPPPAEPWPPVDPRLPRERRRGSALSASAPGRFRKILYPPWGRPAVMGGAPIERPGPGRTWPAQQFAVVCRQVGRLFGPGRWPAERGRSSSTGSSARRDDAAFEAIVARHGPMVLAVCRSLLERPERRRRRLPGDVPRPRPQGGDAPAARPARGLALRRGQQVARRARIQAAAEGSRARGAAGRVGSASTTLRPTSTLRAAVHDEVDRLPASYREAVILCYLQGRTHEEAARELGWPVGTVKGRLSRARDLLRDRLARRGLRRRRAAVLVLLADEGRAAVPPALIDRRPRPPRRSRPARSESPAPLARRWNSHREP